MVSKAAPTASTPSAEPSTASNPVVICSGRIVALTGPGRCRSRRSGRNGALEAVVELRVLKARQVSTA